MPEKQTYAKLPPSPEESTETDDGEEHDSLMGLHIPHTKRHRFWPCSILVASIILFGSSVVLFIVSFKFLSRNDLSCTRQLSSYSPMIEAVEYYEVDWANEFRQESIYRGQPTPELERAWDQLWRHDDINVPLDKLHLLNRSAEGNWKHTPAQYGGGAEANVEVFHQLHCLNMIRQYTYLDSYEVKPEGFTHSAEMSRVHVDHCIETLRIALMCVGDVTPVLIKLDKSKPLGAEADFSSHHKCRRFDRLTDWMKLYSVPSEDS